MQHPVLHPAIAKKQLSHTSENSVRRTKKLSKLSIQLVALLISFGFMFTAQAQVGTWTALTHLAPHQNNGVMLLMSDGSILCHSSSGGPNSTTGGQGDGSVWDKLTPDSLGSYINGTWTSTAPMVNERYSFSSAVLKDGRVYAAGGEYGTDGTQAGYHGEVYNLTANIWTAIPGTTDRTVIFSDGNCILLENGNVLQAEVDVSFPVHTKIYTPATNVYTTGPSALHGDNESMWLKLPDNSVLFVNEAAQTSERYIPATNTWIADGNVPVALYDPYGYECGPGFMLPNGKAFFIGGTGHTAYYTPSGTTAPGTWVAGPDVPSGYSMPDAPGAMMINGKILFAASPAPTQQNEFATPTKFYEFDYTNNTYTAVAAPSTASTSAISQQYNLLVLPDGNVLEGMDENGNASEQYYIYKPVGTPVASGKPVISAITPITCTTYMVTGHGFNGISAGAAFGDENESDENYPIVRFKSGNKVYYARSYNWNSAGVQRGLLADTVYITLPNNLPGSSYMYVVANGIASDSVLFSSQVATLSSPVSSSICSGSAFTYTPTSSTNGATFSWTRAAVTGISNAAITTAQTSNPNEVLVNTTALPVNVVYAYSVTGGGCSNIVNVTVAVNPPPKAAFTLERPTACLLPDSVTFTNTSIAGLTYIWSFGDGGTSTAANPVYPYTTIGSFNVKLVAQSACGKDSVTQANAVVISTPTAPTATSPVNINCNATATLTATASDSIKWYNQSTNGTLLASGGTYTTPVLYTSTTYYVENDVASTPSYSLPLTDGIGSGANYANSNFRSNVFTVNYACTLVSVLVYSGAAGNRTVYLTDVTGNTVLQSLVVNIPNGTSTVTLNFPLTVGTYQLGCGDNSTITNLFRNDGGVAFPYSDPGGYVTIKGNNVPDATHYYFFYDWKLQGPPCKSARTPVTVTTNGPGINTSNGTATNVACNGAATGAATITPSGGTGYTYNWSNGGTTATISNVIAGNYTVTVHDAVGCSGTATETITQPNALNISVTPTVATCGQNTGSVSSTVSGGTTTYRYLWSNAATSANISALGANTYTLTVTDAHSCTGSASAVVSSSGSLSVSANAVAVACNGASTGSANVTLTGGTGTITYLWSNGATTASISNVAANTYTVTVSDGGGCSGTSSATVSQPTALNVSVTSTNSGCGSPNGSAQASVSGGTTTYTYLWSNAATTSSISNLPAATYNLTVTDNHHCTATSSAVVANSGVLNVSVTPDASNCSGGSTGGASAVVNGGTSPFIYLWSNGATTAAISGVVANTYQVTVNDNSGCSGTASIVITTGSVLAVSPSFTDILCFGQTTGAASVNVTTGTTPYQYSWNNGATTSSVTGLTAGNYLVTVTDAHSCQVIDTIVVSQPTSITIFVSPVQPTCVGFSNGSASVSATGGTPGYTYVWSNNATTISVNNLAADSYSVSLTDNNNCTSVAAFSITDPVAVSANLVAVGDSCFGTTDGQINATAAGGTGPYDYLWNDGETTSNITSLASGAYTLTITDNNSCSATFTSTVNQPTQLTVTVSSTSTINGQANGTGTLGNATGGTAPYAYLWSNGQTTSTATGLLAGTYKATVTDHNGCIIVENVMVNDSTVGIATINNGFAFTIYPNPASTEVTIAVGSVDKETTLMLEDVLGQTVYTKTLNATISTLQLASFSEGVYFIELRQDGKSAIKKLVISR